MTVAMMNAVQPGDGHVVGTKWTTGDTGRFPGRFPLTVERHAMAQVGRLLPGVTTVTPHARYYTLHGLVAAEVESRGLAAAEAVDLLRRCEVVFGAVSTAHHDPHPGMAQAHGADKIRTALERDDAVRVGDLAAPKVYAQANWGFWGPYLGSEALLGLVHQRQGIPVPGDGLDVAAVRSALGEVLDLAAADQVSRSALIDHQHLCLCQAAGAADGAMMRERLLPATVESMSPADRRRQSILLLLRLLQLRPEVRSATRDLSPVLLFDEEAVADPVLASLEITPAWQGVVLRSHSVRAWRNLWAWLVANIDGFMAIDELGSAFAEHLPSQTVREFCDSLPTRSTKSALGVRMLGAEISPDLYSWSAPAQCLAVLFVGAQRKDELPDRVAAYFEGRDDILQQLTPTWLAQRITEWLDRPLRDFAVFLTRVLVDRSQRVSLAKARFQKKTGAFRIPTRVFVRDGYIYRDSAEGGGGISLRWDTLTTVLAGVGLVERNGDGYWAPTDAGAEAVQALR